MTREEIAAIDRECEEQHISQQEYLKSHGITRHQYYRWKRRYREEDEQSLVPAGFVPMMPGAAPAQSVLKRQNSGERTALVRTCVGAAFLGQALHPVGLKNSVLYLFGIRYAV